MKHILTLVISVFSLSAYCQDTDAKWDYVVTSADKAKWYIRSEIENNDYDGIHIWTKVVKPTFTYKKRLYKNCYRLQLAVVDCESKKMKFLDTIMYTQDGNVIYNDPNILADFEPIIPDTIMENLYKWVCSHFTN